MYTQAHYIADSYTTKMEGGTMENKICNMPDEIVISDLSDLFKVFGDSSRLKILCSLRDNELCVQDISLGPSMSQSSVSHQLRILKDAKLVKYRRDGKNTYYSLDDEHIEQIINIGVEHVIEQ